MVLQCKLGMVASIANVAVKGRGVFSSHVLNGLPKLIKPNIKEHNMTQNTHRVVSNVIDKPSITD